LKTFIAAIISLSLFINYTKLYGQIILNTVVKQPTCIKGLGHNYEQIGDGSISLIPSGGIPPYKYSLFEGFFPFSVLKKIQNNGYFPGLIDGNWHIEITDAIGGYKYFDTTLNANYNAPFSGIEYSHPSSCSASDGSITFRGTNGTPPYLYSIDGGNSYSANNFFGNLTGGYYTFLTKDAKGCIVYTNNFQPILYLYCDSCNTRLIPLTYSTSCNNEGQAEISAIYRNFFYTPAHPYDSVWKFSNDGVNFHKPNSTPNVDTLAHLSPGFYHVYAKDTTTGIVTSAAYSIGKSCYVYITSVAVDASCKQSDGILTVLATNGALPYSYTINGINFQSSNAFSGLPAGTYTIGVKDANGAINSAVAVVYNKCPIIICNSVPENCNARDGKIQSHGYRGTRPYNFSIDGINFQADSFFNNLGSGVYKVILKDANNYMDSTSVTIKNNCLMVTAFSTDETCRNKNGTITVTGSGGKAPYTYSIDNINFQNSDIFKGLDSGTYIITIKDADGLASTTKVTIGNIAAPAISATATTASCNGTGAIITVTNTGGKAPFLYSIDGMSYQNSNVFNNVNQGNYNVRIKDVNSCTGTDTIQVIKYPAPIFFIGNDTALCTGAAILLKAPKGNQYQYKWQDNSVADTYTVTNTGLYSLKVTNQYNCFFTDTVLILFKSIPNFSLGNDTSLCSGKSLNLQKFTPGWSYLWNTGSILPSISINSPGLFWLKVSDSGCVKTDSIYVSLTPLPIVDLGNDTSICEGQTLQLKINNNNNNNGYLWQDNSTNNTYTVSHEGIYSVFVTKNNCTIGDTIDVQYQLKPNFTLGPDQSICENQTILLQPVVNPGWQLKWNNGSNQSFYKVTTQGTIYLDAKNTCGSTRKEVLFTKGLCKVYVPNSFSPNGDGKNDVFKVSGTESITEFHLQVFNRYGQLIFETTDKNKGWDGSIKNQPVQSGNYVYLLEYKQSAYVKKQMVRGSCLLIR